MPYSPEITAIDRKILEIIEQGHREITRTSTRPGTSIRVSAVTFNELKLELNVIVTDVRYSVAKLEFYGYVESEIRIPSFWGRLTGRSGSVVFWITQEGRDFIEVEKIRSSRLIGARNEKIQNNPADMDQVIAALNKLGYNITTYGVGVARLSLESEYRPCQTASYLALVTLARDAQEAGRDIIKQTALLPHARKMIDILSQFKNDALIREEWFKNDTRAIYGVTIVEKGRAEWISRVLSDPVIAQNRVATSRNNYGAMDYDDYE